MNIELPNDASLKSYAPEKSATRIKRGLPFTRTLIDEASQGRRPRSRMVPPRFAPAGQSTQMVIGADERNEIDILGASAELYASYGLERVYYSAFSPTGHPSSLLPSAPTPLLREHRLYQADWLLRFYGFSLSELGSAAPFGMFDLVIDPGPAAPRRFPG
jgi:predicted DNA-binding helix-hairpin-helix protein